MTPPTMDTPHTPLAGKEVGPVGHGVWVGKGRGVRVVVVSSLGSEVEELGRLMGEMGPQGTGPRLKGNKVTTSSYDSVH